MRWLVPALCAVAALAAIAMGAGGGVQTETPVAADTRGPTPSVPAPPVARDPDDQTVPGLLHDATEAVALPDSDERGVLGDCLAVPEGADPALSPDPDAVDPVASGETSGAAVVVWAGPTPQYEAAVGTCVALDRGSGWTVVGRSVRRDLGADTPSLAWQPAASAAGAGAALVGRVREGAADVIVVLDDDRVLRQEVTGGFVAIPWQPVRSPARLVTLGPDGDLSYDGPLTGYGAG